MARSVSGDEPAFQRFLRRERDGVQAGLAAQRRLLADPLREARQAGAPAARGGEHRFEPRERLQALAARLPAELRHALHLPVRVDVDGDAGGAAYAPDPASGDALRRPGCAPGQPDARGRAWSGSAPARARAPAPARDGTTRAQPVRT